MSDTRIETIILRQLFHNEEYTRKVIPYLKEEYFKQTHEKLIFTHTVNYIAEYNKLPTISVIAVSIEKENVVEETYKEVLETLTELEDDSEKFELDWLIDETEKFCKDKALVCAAYRSVAILEGKDKKLDSGAIPHIFENALAVSFDPSIGHDYFNDAEFRYDTLHADEYKLPFDVSYCNKVTKGGVPSKTLNLLVGGIYVGKTLGLCHLAKSYMCAGKNVLYITLEVSEVNINLRIDCNLLDTSIDTIEDLPKEIFLKKIQKARESTPGKLETKEYPAGSIHVNNIRALLGELKLKKQFIPDVIIIDSMNLMASCRIKASDKTHITILAIAEEVRALAQEYNVPIWSATQLDAAGIESTDPTITQVAGSKVGLLATVDLAWFLICTDKLRELGQMKIIQHKNRYKDASENKRFFIGLDRKKFRWYDVEQRGQTREDDPPEQDEQQMKRDVSKRHGSQPYEPGYKNLQTRKFGLRGKKTFSDFKV
jgi:archaellum biogenesis ATPase FlaH